MPKINDADALCPFYQCTTKKGIVCESFVEDSVIKVLFRETKTMYSYRRIHCCGRYKDCKLFSLLEEQYE